MFLRGFCKIPPGTGISPGFSESSHKQPVQETEGLRLWRLLHPSDKHARRPRAMCQVQPGRCCPTLSGCHGQPSCAHHVPGTGCTACRGSFGSRNTRSRPMSDLDRGSDARMSLRRQAPGCRGSRAAIPCTAEGKRPLSKAGPPAEVPN